MHLPPLGGQPCQQLGEEHDPEQQHNSDKPAAAGDDPVDCCRFLSCVGEKQVGRSFFVSLCLSVYVSLQLSFPVCLCLSLSFSLS